MTSRWDERIRSKFVAGLNKTPVGKLGCWLWQKRKDEDGYGSVRVASSNLKAHRISYELHVGPVPKGSCVLHRCDVRACVNPEHLWLGTDEDNAKDRDEKKRQAIGSRNGRAKLTESDVLKIRRLLLTGKVSPTDLSPIFGVSKAVVEDISRGKTWKHVLADSFVDVVVLES